MKLYNIHAARRLVKPVYILRYNAGQLSRLFQLRQLQMRRVGLCFGKYHTVAVKPIELLGVPHIKRMAHYLLGREAVFLRIQPVLAAEIGNTAFGGNSCSAKENYPFAVVNDFL